MLLSRLPLPRTKTVLLDRSLDRKGREKHLLHFVAVMKVHKSVSTYVCVQKYVCMYIKTIHSEDYNYSDHGVCMCVYLCCPYVRRSVCTQSCMLWCVLHRCSSSLCFLCSTQCLREFNNFNSFLCILSAIESAAVSRLDWSDKVNKVSDHPMRSEPAAVFIPLL